MGSSASTINTSAAKKVGGPAQRKAVASLNHKGKANALLPTIDGASKSLTDISDTLLVSAAATIKRIEEFSDEVKTLLTHFKASIKHIEDCNGFPCTSCLKRMKDFETVSENINNDLTAVGDGLGIDTDFCEMFAYTWQRGVMLQKIEDADPQKDLSHETTQMFTFYIELLGSVWNFTDQSDFFCLQMEEDGCLSLIVDWFLHLVESDMALNKWVDDILFHAMKILENACRRVPSLAPKHHRAVPALQKFGESKESLTQTIAFTTLAKLVKREEADMLSTNYTCIVSLLSLLNECFYNHGHKAYMERTSIRGSFNIGAKAEDLIQSLNDLAINDNNKRLIVKERGIPILAKFLQRHCSVKAKTSAANVIWRLAFLKENKETLRQVECIINDLKKNSQSKHEKLHNACMGALFEIYESRLPEGLTHGKTDVDSHQRAPSSGHIMLSYKWEHPSKPVMQEFKKQLRKRGYNVWMDEDHMMGDKIGAMAEAVENADMIIACITRGYQDSQDCRTEASYAYECKKKIIPVKVSDFRPSGWLGGITAGKIYYMVQQPELVSKVLSGIIEKEFAVQKKTVENVKSAPGPSSPELELNPPPMESQFFGWDSKKVQDWLAANNVTSRNKALKTLNGAQLLQLKKLLITVPQAFYHYMTDDLKVPFVDALSLAAALEKIN